MPNSDVVDSRIKNNIQSNLGYRKDNYPKLLDLHQAINRRDLDRNQLLLSYVEPHKPVVPCTIAGWLVSVLKQAGMDTHQFKAHSTRGKSTSKAKAMGFSYSEILEAARWSKVTTFKRHYLREINNASSKNKFQHTVLS